MGDQPTLLLVETRSVATPEDIEVRVDLAGIGARAIAAAIDLGLALLLVGIIGGLLALVLTVGLSAILGKSGAAIASGLSLAVVALGLFLYWFWPEWRWDGATPGKKALHLSVVRDGGLPMTAAAATLRTLLRLVDFIPWFYGLGLVVTCASPDRKRIGDHLAGTVVVRQRRPEPGTGVIWITPRPPEAWMRLDLAAITDDDELLVRRFLVRRTGMQPQVRASLAARIAAMLEPKVMGAVAVPWEPVPGEWFLENIALATAARHSRWLPPSLGGLAAPPPAS